MPMLRSLSAGWGQKSDLFGDRSQEEAVWAHDQKSMLLRLKRWLSGVGNQFLLQRTWVQFLLPSWWLTIPVLEVTAPSLGH